MNNADWTATLAAIDDRIWADPALGTVLRVLSATQQDCVCLCTGVATLPYVEYLRDGLKMSSRMIIHLDPAAKAFESAVQYQLEADIRLASHVQPLADFASDIARHRIDLLIADVTPDNKSETDALIALLGDCALLVALAGDTVRNQLEQEYADEYFVAYAGAEDEALIMTRKGRQHRLSRRGGRRARPGR